MKSLGNLYVPQNDKFDGYTQYPRPRIMFPSSEASSARKIPRLHNTKRVKLDVSKLADSDMEETKAITLGEPELPIHR